MASKPCRACKKLVASEANSCPHCGAPNPVAVKGLSGCGLLLVVSLLVVGFAGLASLMFSDRSAESPTRSGSSPRQQQEEELERALVTLRESNQQAVEIRQQNGDAVWAWYVDDGGSRDALAGTYCVELAEQGLTRPIQIRIIDAGTLATGAGPKFIGRANCRDGRDTRRR